MDKVQQRVITVALVVIALFALLFARLIYLQVFEYKKLGSISDTNSLRRIWEQAPRGRMIDRNGTIIVTNQPLYNIKVIPSEFNRESIGLMASLLEMEKEELEERIEKGRRYNRFAPSVVERDIEQHQMMRLNENLWQLPGVLIEVENKRKYTDSIRASHLLGYLSLISKQQLESMADKGYSPDDKTGSKGLEKSYEEVLRGEKGVRYELVNSIGRVVGKFEEGAKDQPFINGNDIHLTIDAGLQKVAEQELAKTEKPGAVVAINPRDGGILAMTSQPDYDLETLNGRTDREKWLAIAQDPRKPLFNRAIQATYPPGSVYKLLLAIAALEEDAISTSKKILCTGVFRLGRGRFLCHGGQGHGPVNMKEAIVESCNTYFYELIFDVGFEKWTEYGRMFGFGKTTGIDIPGERSAPLPSSDYYDKRYGKGKWTRGYLVSLAIGQGELNTTPLQLAAFTAAIANKGTYYQPHVVQGYRETGNGTYTDIEFSRKKLPVSESTLDFITESMEAVVERGTGRIARLDSVRIAGKTGTAQNPHGKDHAWFVAFAPVEDPSIAIAVLVENAGYGSSNAGPIARAMINYYVNGPEPAETDETTTEQTTTAQETSDETEREP
ncbi:penicillin-binding protein 2 [Prosthecochloris sp. N3]|uniref:Penicillin-binding protein 2 n=1 Tax=Prosthecochloris ethylica TaxID=2743976 RepID=A0ABR9XS91_9CHLB|nr:MULTISPECIES: penicillin-binding protein 2 [Prosthecochloris]MBF0586735.1 penicillin-binding protein 2 [Prosthecochloris ethylica]MBF0636641.1 penicillin-binding protein 2 [Prosthecochloris ethylica]NUK47960.1 penicillin-binding protein 2 [Prosthecochloris ethylica]RNA65261.1 penicillin-binding protein 2 [Prosthecochloris sp. ZM_2]